MISVQDKTKAGTLLQGSWGNSTFAKALTDERHSLEGKCKGSGTRQFTNYLDYGWKIFQKIMLGRSRKNLGESPTIVRFPLWGLAELEPTRGLPQDCLLPPPCRNRGMQKSSTAYFGIALGKPIFRGKGLSNHTISSLRGMNITF